jgi:enoyl-CoA hydratase/carnithine racemase
MNEDVLSSIDEGIGYITLNRPNVHNAISTGMWREIPMRMEELLEEGASAIVFRGKGDSFASGADLEELRKIESEAEAQNVWHAIRDCLEFVWSFTLPTVAMIHGVCIGGGCLLAISCDLRIAARSSSFAVPVAKLGLLLDDRTVARIVAAAGVPFAKELLFTAASITAERAYQLGFLNRIAGQTDLERETSALIQQLDNNVIGAIIAAKSSVNFAANLPAIHSCTTDDQVVASYLTQIFRARLNSLASKRST